MAFSTCDVQSTKRNQWVRPGIGMPAFLWEVRETAKSHTKRMGKERFFLYTVNKTPAERTQRHDWVSSVLRNGEKARRNCAGDDDCGRRPYFLKLGDRENSEEPNQ